MNNENDVNFVKAVLTKQKKNKKSNPQNMIFIIVHIILIVCGKYHYSDIIK